GSVGVAGASGGASTGGAWLASRSARSCSTSASSASSRRISASSSAWVGPVGGGGSGAGSGLSRSPLGSASAGGAARAEHGQSTLIVTSKLASRALPRIATAATLTGRPHGGVAVNPKILAVRPRVRGPVLAALLIPLLACPPTSIPARGQPGGHVPVSLHDAPHELQPTSVAPRSLPTPNQRLPLWDLDASLAEVEARLALNEPPSWVPWISWVLMDLSEHKSGSRRLLDALASSELSAEHLAWWRSITPD